MVVGGGAAGASAAARARRLDPNAEVILIERGSMITHAPCGMPYAIGGIVKSHEELMTYTPEEFEKERNIKVLTRTAVVDIDVDKHVVVTKRGETEERITWDKLVIATGAKPLVPNIPGADLKGILTLRHPDEVPDLKGHLEKAKTVAVVGGGYIGVEMADVLLDMGKRVLLFEMFDQVLPASLDPDTAAVVAEEIRGRGDYHFDKTHGLGSVAACFGLKTADASALLLLTTSAALYVANHLLYGLSTWGLPATLAGAALEVYSAILGARGEVARAFNLNLAVGLLIPLGIFTGLYT